MAKELTQFKKGMIPWNKGKIGVQISTRKGKKLSPHSEETRKKMSLARIGQKCSIETRLKIGVANTGKKRSLEFCEAMSLFKTGAISPKKGRPSPETSGEKNWRWISDRSLLKDDHKDRGGQLHREWSKSVKNRDGWKCKISNGDCSGRLEAHHILGWKSYPELRYQITNGITLCHFHHPRKRDGELKLSPYFQDLVKEAN